MCFRLLEYKKTSVMSDSTNNSKAWGWIIFILGVIVGVIGLCVAFRLIFYLGLAVIVAGVVALLVGGARLRRSAGRRAQGRDDAD